MAAQKLFATHDIFVTTNRVVGVKAVEQSLQQ